MQDSDQIIDTLWKVHLYQQTFGDKSINPVTVWYSLSAPYEGDEENVSDPEERNYLLELLEEQNERSESIIKAEDQRLSKELELLNVKCQITEDLYNLKVSFLESLLIKINLIIITFSATWSVPKSADLGVLFSLGFIIGGRRFLFQPVKLKNWTKNNPRFA